MTVKSKEMIWTENLEAHTPIATTKNPAEISGPMALIEMAVTSDLAIEKLERLMELQQRWEAEQSRKGFFCALAQFQSNCPNILKTKKGHNNFYAPLDAITDQIRRPLFDAGLSYRWRQEQSERMITVTCIITHVGGHSEETSMYSLGDYSGKKTDIHAIASADSYLRRYTLTSILGISTADADNDGQSATNHAPNYQQSTNLPPYPEDRFNANFAEWSQLVLSGKYTANHLLQLIQTKGALSEGQILRIKSI